MNMMPPEPSYQVVAQAVSALYTISEDDPLFEVVYEYWQDAIEGVHKTNHSRAINADEYIALQNGDVIHQKHGNFVTYAEIKQRVNVQDFAERFTDRLIQSGGKFRCKCFLPGHAEKTASLWLYPESNSFYCFGCRQGGDLIDMAKLMGMDPKELI